MQRCPAQICLVETNHCRETRKDLRQTRRGTSLRQGPLRQCHGRKHRQAKIRPADRHQTKSLPILWIRMGTARLCQTAKSSLRSIMRLPAEILPAAILRMWLPAAKSLRIPPSSIQWIPKDEQDLGQRTSLRWKGLPDRLC